MSELPKPRPLSHTLDDYYAAVSGFGPLAYDWKDKPHRLIYDLIAALRHAEQCDPCKVALNTCIEAIEKEVVPSTSTGGESVAAFNNGLQTALDILHEALDLDKG